MHLLTEPVFTNIPSEVGLDTDVLQRMNACTNGNATV